MADIFTELENTKEVLSNKVLEVQEAAFYYGWRFKCVHCGIIIKPQNYTNFDDFKNDTEKHTKICVAKLFQKWMETK